LNSLTPAVARGALIEKPRRSGRDLTLLAKKAESIAGLMR
jgi:hypothetical protein